MTTPLKNNYIGKFDEKLKIYDSIFFKSIDGSGGLLAEASKITEPNGLRIPTNKNATTYNTAQFSNFIRNIVNFNIKNFNMLDDRDNNMGFVSRTIGRNGTPAYIFNENVKTNIIETLKVVNVFVDILEAYKYCIDNKDKEAVSGAFDTGFTVDMPIHRIEIVSGKTRFYNDAKTTMTPASTVLNAGYIRSIKEYEGADKNITVLYLSIQSFNTGMVDAKYNYNNLFTKTNDNATFNNTPENILNSAALTGLTTSYALARTDYPRQTYSGLASDPKAVSNLTLENRNKALILILLKTLYNLDMNFRTQSVYALYYYYKFVQLYSGLVINVSNVMYADLTITSPLRIDTRNMTTSKAKLGVSGIELVGTNYVYSAVPTLAQSGSTGGGTITAADITVASASTAAGGSSVVNIAKGGTGFTGAPTIDVSGGTLASGSVATAKATIVPIAIEYTSRTNEENIDKLRDVMTEISDALSELITDISKYTANSDTSQVICTAYPDANPTTASFSTDNKVILNITKPCLISALNKRSEKDDFVNDFTVYDEKNKIYYSIIRINNEDTANFKIEINAVFTADDILEKDIDTKVFKKSDGSIITKPATADAKASITTGTDEFLKISRKDINAYKTEYIYNRNDLEKLNENIGYNSSKVTHQTNQYQAQFNKNLFLERQILTYNIILAIIILVLLGINVANIDRQLVKTISLSCLGTIVLLFIIYFISNITYIETFVASTDALIVITAAHYGDKRNKLNPTSYNNQKLNTLKNEVDKLNAKFISYFEKIIITLPSTDNLDFYREIKDVITNDRDNKQFINKRLEYNKSQNSNDINSLKYELENNKLYINTLLISAIIFVGLYNLYINYATSDKYLSLLLFVSAIIFIIIVAYYLITSNRRVKTVFKNVYWGPEFSKRF
jgi:hypothetical protein